MDGKEIVSASESADWVQVAFNGGQPCFRIQDGRFCFRAHRWDGHQSIHRFVSFPEFLTNAIAQARAEEREACCIAVREACIACDGRGEAEGRIPGGFVSREMALDAGDPSLEGQPLPSRSYECEYCGRPISAIRAL